jgi:hypothetical protein
MACCCDGGLWCTLKEASQANMNPNPPRNVTLVKLIGNCTSNAAVRTAELSLRAPPGGYLALKLQQAMPATQSANNKMIIAPSTNDRLGRWTVAERYGDSPTVAASNSLAVSYAKKFARIKRAAFLECWNAIRRVGEDVNLTDLIVEPANGHKPTT